MVLWFSHNQFNIIEVMFIVRIFDLLVQVSVKTGKGSIHKLREMIHACRKKRKFACR